MQFLSDEIFPVFFFFHLMVYILKNIKYDIEKKNAIVITSVHKTFFTLFIFLSFNLFKLFKKNN